MLVDNEVVFINWKPENSEKEILNDYTKSQALNAAYFKFKRRKRRLSKKASMERVVKNVMENLCQSVCLVATTEVCQMPR